MTLHHKHLQPLSHPQHLASFFYGIFIYKAKAIIHRVFFSVTGAAQDNYFDEESEDNYSDEEGDIDEDMMGID